VHRPGMAFVESNGKRVNNGKGRGGIPEKRSLTLSAAKTLPWEEKRDVGAPKIHKKPPTA